MAKPDIILAMSGGVDSSVAISLLSDYNVIGVTFIFCGDAGGATAAAQTARKFGIPHHIIDRRSDFTERVVVPFAQSYQSGETPNPCVLCNRVMKFPALFDAAEQLGCEYVATGHYARCENGTLMCALDGNGQVSPKDQSYMLYGLTPQQLKRIVFPLGNISKAAVRERAAQLGLACADTPDSQDICFIPDGDYAAYIKNFAKTEFSSGSFVSSSGEVLGKHNGHIHYTPGQRRGLGLSHHSRLYVVGKCAKTNVVTLGEKCELYTNSFNLKDVVWHTDISDKFKNDLAVKVRYSAKPEPCSVEICNNTATAVCSLTSGNCIAAPGQSAVFYVGEKVIGGGIIAAE